MSKKDFAVCRLSSHLQNIASILATQHYLSMVTRGIEVQRGRRCRDRRWVGRTDNEREEEEGSGGTLVMPVFVKGNTVELDSQPSFR
jgi:hypothetical protein